ncbi:MAG: polysaccharide deacetylase family protein [Candidatus Gracilibacteria bacterium]
MSLFLSIAALFLLGNQHSEHMHEYVEAARYFYSLPAELPANTTAPKKQAPLFYVNIPVEPRFRPNMRIFHTSAPTLTSTGTKLIALTFDDGPSKKETPRLLDILKTERVKATFFVLGKNAEAHPEIIKRAFAEGHEIENHSWDHKDLTKLSQEQLLKEIRQTDEVIERLTKRIPLFLRPPYGTLNKALEQWSTYDLVLWSIDTKDWQHHDSTYIQEYILKHVKDRDIILLHDIHATSVDTVSTLIPILKEQGYTFVTVEELLSEKIESSHKTLVIQHG